MSTDSALRIEDVMATSSVDTRSLDLYPALFLASDTVATIVSIVVTRVDGLPAAIGDLLITPPGFAVPSIGENDYGVSGMLVTWWQGVGTEAQLGGAEVDYEIVVSITTTAGRRLSYALLQLVSSVVG